MNSIKTKKKKKGKTETNFLPKQTFMLSGEYLTWMPICNYVLGNLRLLYWLYWIGWFYLTICIILGKVCEKCISIIIIFN